MKIKWYSKQGLWALFLICAFLPHLWTFILFFNDISMLLYRTRGAWGAIGVLSYGLLYAFVESLFIFLITSLLGLLISARWDESRRVTLLGFLVTLTLFWIIIGQSYYAWHIHVPVHVGRFLAPIPHLVETLDVVTLALVLAITLPPTYLILQRDSFYASARNIADRVTLLSSVYLAIDILALIVVVIRNI